MRNISSTMTSVLAAAAGLFIAGCALTSKSDPIESRFFSPDLSTARVRVTSADGAAKAKAGGSEEAAAAAGGVELRMGRVLAAAHLREKIAHRTSGHELTFYEERRWTERPDAYLRRALEQSLFESGAFVRVVSGDAPTLEVELLAFQEAKSPHVAELRFVVRVFDGRTVRWEETIAVDEKLSGNEQEELASALGRALVAGSDRVTQNLRGILKPRSP